MQMRLLLLGDDHLLKQSLQEQAQDQDIYFEVCSFSDEELSKDKLEALIQTIKPDCIVNLAYYFEWFQSRQSNIEQVDDQVKVVEELALLCEKYDIILFQLSSYRVFSGEKVTAYTETDVPAPISALGNSLYRMEQVVSSQCTKHILMRLGCILDYSPQGKLGSLIVLAENSSEVALADDRRGNPTPIDDAARVILAILQQLDCAAHVWGIYQYGGMEATTPLVWGQVALTEAKLYQTNITDQVIPKTHDDFQDSFIEPQYATLSCKKVLHTFGIKQRAWRTAIPPLFKRYYNQSTLGDDDTAEKKKYSL